MRKGRFQSSLIAAIVPAVFSVLFAASESDALMARATMSQLTAGASHIIRGRVAEVTSQWNDENTTIFTYVTIVVDRSLKGDAPGAVTLRIPGGQVGDVGLFVEDMPVFTEAQEVFVFVKPGIDESFMEVHGFFQGKFTVEEGRVIEAGLSSGDFVEMVNSIVKLQERELNQK